MLVGAHGDGVLRARIWVAADVTAATLETPNGALPLPIPLLTATRVMAIYIHNIPWWQQAVVRFVATPTHDPQAVIAFAGLAWHPHPDAAIWLAGLWVIALASIGVTCRDGRMAVVLALVALLVVWSWPTAIPWLAGACCLVMVGILAGWRAWHAASVRWLWCVAMALTYGLGVARMARRPSDFAELHWLLSYDAGFVKRGLIGSLLPYAWQSESGIWWLSALVLVLAIIGHAVCIGWLVTQPTREPIVLLTALVVACSPVALMQGFLIGYFDALVVLGVLIGFWWVQPGKRSPAWVGVVWALLVLVHEITLLYVLAWSMVTAALVVVQLPRRDWRGRVQAIWQPLWVMSLPALMLVGMVIAQRMQSDGLVHAGILSRAGAAQFATQDSGYDVARQVADWTVMSFAAHYTKYHGLFWERLSSRESWVVLPTLVILWLCTWLVWGRRPGRWLVVGAVIGATLLPIGVDVIAIDTGRIASYTIVIGWYALIGILRAAPNDTPTALPVWFWGVTVAVIVGNCAVQPFWLVPYDIHAALPIQPWILVVTALLPFAWQAGTDWIGTHKAAVTAL